MPVFVAKAYIFPCAFKRSIELIKSLSDLLREQCCGGSGALAPQVLGGEVASTLFPRMKNKIIPALLLVASLFAGSTSQGATFTVTTTDDDGVGSLRQALANAAALPGDDTIDFDPSVTGTIWLGESELVVNSNVFISGPGAANLTVRGAYYGARIFHIRPGQSVTISGLTIADGYGYQGGGIFNDRATLVVSNCTLTGNTSVWRGGGISNSATGGNATLTINNSTLRGNTISALHNHAQYGNAIVTINNSTLSGNSNGFGGAIDNYGENGSAAVTINNSTFSGNSATNRGGAIVSLANPGGSARVTINNSTFSGNPATDASLSNLNNTADINAATIDITGTILNADAGANFTNIGGLITSHGYNISSDNGGGFLTASGDQVGIDPKLGPLQDNGGPTFTHELLSGSPAINAGDPNFNPAIFTPAMVYDQRAAGFDRVVNGRIDVGAFELEAALTVLSQPKGYWKNNPVAWQVNELTLGSQTYTQSELLFILNLPIGSGKNADASLILAVQLIAAKLNIASGVDPSSVSSTITHADGLLSGYSGKLPYRVKPSTAKGIQMVEDAVTLETYN
jgi:hypothetical protein